MLESEGILIRDKDKFLQDVIICKKNESRIPEIFEAVKRLNFELDKTLKSNSCRRQLFSYNSHLRHKVA